MLPKLDVGDNELGDRSVSEIAGHIKTDFNGYIAKNMPNAASFTHAGKPDYANVFWADGAGCGR